MFPIATVLSRYYSNIFVKTLYFTGATVLGFVFLMFFSAVIFDIIRLFAKTNPQIFGIILFAIVCLLTIYGLINASFINTKTIMIPLKGLEKELTVVQISDVHLGVIHSKNFLDRLVAKINGINPDLVLITGDLFDGGEKITEDSISLLNKINAETFFTIGNHEIYDDVNYVTKILGSTKVRVLRNEVVEYKGIQIVGIDNPEKEFSSKNDFLCNMVADKNKPSILMYHVPSGMECAKNAGISLQLSGHTHNGQVFPFTFFSWIAYPYVNGLYNYKGMYLYVSPGTGTWGPPMRIGSSNEITVIKLVKNK